MMRKLLLLAPLALLAGCGKIAPIEPGPGRSLPVKPAMAATVPTAEELLTRRADAAPQRIDELMKRSAPRKADRFDLPPPDGGAAPVLLQPEQPTSSDKPGVKTPQ